MISNEERESTKKKTESLLQEGLIGMQLNACPLHQPIKCANIWQLIINHE